MERYYTNPETSRSLRVCVRDDDHGKVEDCWFKYETPNLKIDGRVMDGCYGADHQIKEIGVDKDALTCASGTLDFETMSDIQTAASFHLMLASLVKADLSVEMIFQVVQATPLPGLCKLVVRTLGEKIQAA